MGNKGKFIPIRRGRVLFLLCSALAITAVMSTLIVSYIWYEFHVSEHENTSYVVDRIYGDYMNTMGRSESRAAVEKSYRNQMAVIEGVINDLNISDMNYAQKARAASFLHKLCEISDSDELYFVDSTGNNIVSVNKHTIGRNIVQLGLLCQDHLDQLLDEAADPEDRGRSRVIVEREGDRLIFLSKKLRDNDGNDTGIYMLMGCNASVIENNEAKAMDTYLLMELGYNTSKQIDFAVYSVKDGSFIYQTERLSEGRHPFDVDVVSLIPYDGEWTDVLLGGESHDCYVRVLDRAEDGQIVVIGILHDEFSKVADGRNYSYVYFLAPVYLLLAILLIIYGYQLERKSKNKYLGRGLYLGVLVVCTGLFFIIAYFLVSLRQVTETVYLAENGMALLSEKTESSHDRQAEAIDYYKAKDITAAEVIAYSMEYSAREILTATEAYPYYKANSEGDYVPVRDAFGNELLCYQESKLLKDKESLMTSGRMWLINEKGYAIASSSDRWCLNLNEIEDGDELRRVMFMEDRMLYKFEYDENGNAVGTRIACPVNIYAYSDGSGRTRYATYNDYIASQEGASPLDIRRFRGLLLIEMEGKPSAMQILDLYVDETMNSVLNDIGCSYVRISDPDANGVIDRKVRLCDGMDIDLSSIEVPSKMHQDKFNFIREIDKRKFFIHMERDNVNHRYVALVIDNRDIHFQRMRGVGMGTLISFVGLLLLMMLVMGTRGANDYLNPESSGRLAVAGDSRGVVLVKRFMAKKPEEKLMMSLQAVLVAFVVFIIAFFASKSGEGHERFYTDIYSQEFERAVNFYNISASLGVLAAIIVCFSLIKKVIDIICDPLGEKFETYATLTVTIFQCLLLFCGLFYGAYLLGMEVRSIGTLATVAAGAIGLGSKEIIGDITAGIQIVTGGKVVLGDLICVDGFTGVVKEMRLRCCMLENKEGMIKSVPNSKMISVVVIERKKK